jgi:hypothetical protein
MATKRTFLAPEDNGTDLEIVCGSENWSHVFMSVFTWNLLRWVQQKEIVSGQEMYEFLWSWASMI